MLPASGHKFVGDALGVPDKSLPRAGDDADLGESNSGKLRRNALGGRNGEQKFVIFAAVQGQVEINLARGLAHAGAGNECGFDFRSHAAFFADVGQVGGKAVAEVNQSMCSGEDGSRQSVRHLAAPKPPASTMCAQSKFVTTRETIR